MHLGIDLDDVLADLIGGLIRLHADMHGVRLDREQVTGWDVFPEDVHRRMMDGGYAALAPLPGARDFLRELRTDGHRLTIITYRSPRVQDLSRTWLDRHFPELWDGLVCTGGGKVESCRRLGVDLLVDDSLHQAPAVVRELGIPAVLITSPMNRHVRAGGLLYRADSLDQALAVIRRIAGRFQSRKNG